MPERGQRGVGASEAALRSRGGAHGQGRRSLAGTAALSSPIPGSRMGFALESNPWRTMAGPHVHDCLEISYVLQGSGLFMVADAPCEMSPGILFVIPPGVAHCAVDPPEGRHWNLSLYLRPDSVAWLGTRAEGIVRRVALVGGRRLAGTWSRAWEYLFAQLGELCADRAQPDEAMIATKLLEACLLAERCPADMEGVAGLATGTRPLAGPEQVSEHFVSMLAVIDSDPRAGARQVAERVGLHPHYASYLFGRATGLSLTQYIRRRHLECAQRLVATSAISIAEVADICGFRDLSTFYRAFVKEFRLTPGAIRRQGAMRTSQAPTGRLPTSGD